MTDVLFTWLACMITESCSMDTCLEWVIVSVDNVREVGVSRIEDDEVSDIYTQ